MYQQVFHKALAECLEHMSPRDRNLLRYSVAEGLSIDQIGAIYRVHRSTAARWLTRARDELLDALSTRLRTTLKVNPAELRSILRLIASRVDVNVAEMLQ